MNLLPFVNNVTLIIALVVTYRLINDKLNLSKMNRQLLQGLLFGCITIFSMLLSWKMSNGVIFDARTVILVIAGFFGGPVVALIGSIIAIIYRVFLGGVGQTTGILTILLAGSIGVVAYYCRFRFTHIDSLKGLYVTSLILHIGVSLLMLTLPAPFGEMAFRKTSIPMLILYPLGTVLIGMLLGFGKRFDLFRSMLSQKTDRYLEIFDNASAGIAIVNANGIFQEVNNKFCKMLKYSQVELLQKRFSEVTHPDDLSKDEIAFTAMHNGEFDNYKGVKRYLTSDGSVLWVNRSLQVVRDELGKIDYFVSVIVDISLLKTNEEELLKSKSRFQHALKYIPEVVVLYDSDLRIRFINETTTRLTGRTRDEYLGKTDEEIWPSEICQKWLPALQRTFSTGKTQTVDINLSFSESEVKHLKITCVPLLNTLGDVEEVLGFTQDLTEILNSKQQISRNKDALNRAQKIAHLGSWELDLKDDTIEGSDELYRLYGIEPQSIQLTSELTREFVHPKDIGKLMHARSIMLTGNEVDFKYRIIRKGGELRYVWCRGGAVFDDEGKAIRLYGSVMDVTEKENVLRELEFRNTYLKSLIEFIPDLVWLKDPNGVYLSANRRFEGLFGAEEGEIIGKTDYDFVDKELADFFRINDKRALELGKPSMNEEEVSFADGHSELLETIKTPMFRSDGSLIGVLGIARDITERKKSELSAKESERRLRTLIENIPGIVYSCINKKDWPMNFLSAACMDLTGYSPDELSKDGGVRYGDLIHKEDQKHVWDTIQKAIENKEQFQINYRINNRNGEIRWVWERGQAVDINEEGVEIIEGLITDITDHVKTVQALQNTSSELHKLTHAIEQSSNIIVITDQDGIIVYVNPRFEQVTGYCKDEVVGKTPGIFKSDFTDNDTYKELWDTITSGETWRGEFQNKKKNGELYWESALISPVKDEDNQIVNFIAVKEDITKARQEVAERKKLEAEINQARKLEAVGSLASGIAHEINTPIQFVSDNTQFLADSFMRMLRVVEHYDELFNKVKSNIKEYEAISKQINIYENTDLDDLKNEVPAAIQQTIEGIQRITTIVQAMNEFSYGTNESKAMADINRMLESTLTVANNEYKYVADIVTDFETDLPIVECYQSDMNQVFLNLLVNSAHAIDEAIKKNIISRGRINITTRIINNNMVVSFSDNGVGIPEDIQHRIFDPFFTTKEVGKGTGQGLAISHKIVVQKHKGSLTFDTLPGNGTTFTITIPVCVHKETEVIHE